MAAVFGAAAFGQSGDFSNSGRVVTGAGAAISNATVTYVSLAKRLCWDFSDANGNFGPAQNPVREPRQSVALAAGPVDIDLFDFQGARLASYHCDATAQGRYLLEAAAARLSKSVYIVKVKNAGTVSCRKLLPFGRGSVRQNAAVLSQETGPTALVKMVAAAAIDTIRVGKTGFTPVLVPIDAYASNVGSVTLQPIDIEGQVTTLMGQMSQAEKIGQLLQAQFPGASAAQSNMLGEVFSGAGGPTGNATTTAGQWASNNDSYQSAALGTARKIPLLIGANIVHGFSDCFGAAICPHAIGLGCTFDPKIVQKVYRVAAIESRGGGINWAFAPCIAVARDDRWGREYEAFAETPDLTSVMSRASVLGFQTSDLSNPLAVAVCVKHFAGDGGTAMGTGWTDKGGFTGILDRGNATGVDATLRAIHLPGYTAAVQAGAASIMASFSAWNGVRMHENAALLNDWLKGGQGFDGFINGDWLGHVTGTTGGNNQAKTQNCMVNGLDIPMGPSLFTDVPDVRNAVTALFASNPTRVNDALRRLLRVKYRMGLMSGSPLTNAQVTSLVGSQPHRDIAREAVRKSLVLLKTSAGLLPLSKTAKITLVGQHAQDIGLQCGGWTLSWQGLAGNISAGTTILQGFQAIGGSANVNYSADGGSISGDVAVVCVGERPYAEWYGDSTNIALPGAGVTLVTNAKRSGKPVLVIVISGRPRDVSSIMSSCDGLVAAWLPGTEGLGVAEVLYGNYPFTGKLAFSWPRSTAQEPINSGDATYDPLFPYDHGLNAAGQPLPKGIYQ